MNHIYIIHESQSSKFNGIGTYLKELVKCCKASECKVSLVDVNADYEQISIPSYTEQCSYTGIEMLMFGLPIVTTDGNGLKSMFTHEENALVANIGRRKDSAAFSRHLLQCFRKMLNEKTRTHLARNARDCYCERYTQEQMSNGYIQILKNHI